MKLHLPKVLFTAVVAAVCCVQQAMATEYYINGSTGKFHESTFQTEDGKTPIDKGDAAAANNDANGGNWRVFSTVTNITGASVGDHTLILHEGSGTGDLEVQYNDFAAGAIKVLEGTTITGIDAASSADRTFYIGGNSADGYTSVFEENFTIAPTLAINLSGKQTWNISEGVKVTLKSVAGSDTTKYKNFKVNIAEGANVTFSGGTLAVQGTMNNQGTLTFGNTMEITSFEGLILNDTLGVTYEGDNGDTVNGYRTISNAHYYLVQNNGNGTTSGTVTANLVTGSTSTALTVVSDASGISVASDQSLAKSTDWYYVNSTVNYGGEDGVNDAPGFALNGGTLNLNSSLDSTVVTNEIKATTGTTSTLNLANGVVLNRDDIALEANSIVNLKGTGTVLVQGKSLNGSSSLGLGTGEGWNGVVELKDCTAAGYGFNNYGSKLRLNGVTGWFKQHTQTSTLLEIAEGGWKITDSSNSTNKLNGKVSGTGDITYASPLAGSSHSYNLEFYGDTSEWSGNITINDYDTDINTEGMQAKPDQSIVRLKFYGGSAFDADGNSTITSNRSNGTVEVNVGKSGTTTQMNAAVKKAGDAAVNVIAEHNTVFNKSLDVTSLQVRAGATATLKAESTTGSVTVASTGALMFDGGTLNVTGSLTLDASAIKIAESLTKDAATKTLITVSGEGSTLNVNGSWTGSTYIIGGQRYTTSLNNTGSVLQLEFDQVLTLNLEVATAQLANGVLTLNVNEDLTGITGVDLTLSDAALAVIDGQFGTVELDLVGLNDTGDSVTSISFYNGAYVGEGNGTYRVEYIPEPATATLSLLALAGLAARRRRR